MQVKAGFAWERGGQCLCLFILKVKGTSLSDDHFQFLLMTTSGALRGLLELPLFQGETGLYVDEWTGMSPLSHFLQFPLQTDKSSPRPSDV